MPDLFSWFRAIYLFTGTYDLLNCDAHLLIERKKESHVYPLTPTRYGHKDLQNIIAIIEKSRG